MTKHEIAVFKEFACAAGELYGGEDPIRAGQRYEKAKAAIDALPCTDDEAKDRTAP